MVASAGFDSAYTFEFSPRPGTRAAEHPEDFVDPDVVSERFVRLRDVVERSALLRNEARVGRVEEVLVEGPSRRDPTTLTARTRQGKPVHFVGSVDELAPGTRATVTIRHGAPHHLLGELTEVLEGPRHRTRIPIAVR